MNYPTPPNGLPTVIDSHREQANLSRNALADGADIPRPTFVRRMRRADFTIIELDRVATALGTTASTLLAESEAQAKKSAA